MVPREHKFLLGLIVRARIVTFLSLGFSGMVLVWRQTHIPPEVVVPVRWCVFPSFENLELVCLKNAVCSCHRVISTSPGLLILW